MKKQIFKDGNELQKYQGDVSCVVIDASFAKDKVFKPLTGEGYTIAIGETTGNKHVVVKEREDAVIEFAEDEHGIFLRVLSGKAELTGHREHEAFTIETLPKEQVWFVGRQQEYDPLIKWKQVQD
ncbi:MAG: hypothetical protein QME51_07720 [Planctomycetota bacterium]|nr:hypothetical protein [Planctomycetota bacterium]